jgi:hypothetical protein
MDPNMNNLLKWSIENSTSAQQAGDSNGAAPAPTSRSNLNPEMLSALFGGPSDADLMKAAMEALHSDEVDLENKMIAFDNFEQLIESIDNANNLEPLGLLTPLVELLKHEEAEMRRMAAWCIGTAVQNNEKAQDKVRALFRLAFSFIVGKILTGQSAAHRFQRPPNPRGHVHLRPGTRRSQEGSVRHLFRSPQLPTCHGRVRQAPSRRIYSRRKDRCGRYGCYRCLVGQTQGSPV